MSVWEKSSPLKSSWSFIALASVGEAITEVKPRWMAAFSKIKEGLACQVALIDRDWFQHNPGSTMARGIRPQLPFNDHG